MRIRIIRARPGEVDGIALDTFQPGFVYDVSSSLATYLIMGGTAEPVMDEDPALAVPLHEFRTNVNIEPDRAIAADSSERNKPRGRKS